jgi:hypothetical protein
MEPYHPSTNTSATSAAALACKSFRVFGLNDGAWKLAREDAAAAAAASNGKEEASSPSSELLQISRAILTALSEDAGGFGTAGFHTVSFFVRVDIFLMTYSCLGEIIPCVVL